MYVVFVKVYYYCAITVLYIYTNHNLAPVQTNCQYLASSEQKIRNPGAELCCQAMYKFLAVLSLFASQESHC